MQRDNNTFYIQHTSICPIPVINTYVQFTVQQFYYFLIFTLRQIFCTKENRRTISSLFPDTPETRRWCAGAAGASGNNTTHFQTDLLLLLRRYNCKLRLQTKVFEDFTIRQAPALAFSWMKALLHLRHY